MPRNKDLKRLVRTRMEKTGEAYTTARAQVQKKTKTIDYAQLAGMADPKVVEKTGRNWAEWTAVLDSHKAHSLPHGKITALLSDEYGVSSWWRQMVAVGYERIKGMREIGQRADGKFEANKSRTFNVPVTVLFNAWNDTRTRRRWLTESVKVRTATSPKTLRLDWPDGNIIAAWFESKGPSKSTVAIAHTKLASRTAADRAKKEWAERLDALGELLAKHPRD